MSFDLETVRADFPILAQRINGHRLVYLDNGATAQKPKAVIDRIAQTYAHDYANVHRGLHTLSQRATGLYEQARDTVRRFLNAGRAEEIVFTKGATEAINLVASSFAAPRIGEGDEIVLTIMEHHSNIIPWHFLRERQGAVLRWVDVTDEGAFDLDVFEKALSARTKLVAVTHMSNVTGTVIPLEQIVKRAHARGIPVLVDGSQGAVHKKVDVTALDVDFYVITGHKLYGPSGIGALYGKYELLDGMRPYQGGGEMIEEVTLAGAGYAEPPFRFEAGTPPIVEAIGLGTALDYLEALGRDAVFAHETEVAAYAGERLSRINSLRLIGTAPGKGAIFSFEIEGAHAHDISAILNRYGIAVRAGTHCAQPLLARFGAGSTCRASFGLYNGRNDVDALCEALEKAKEFFA